MSGVDTIIGLIVVFMTVVALVFVTGVFNMVVGPVYDHVVSPTLMSDLGWGSPNDVILLFGGLAMVSLLGVIVMWWILKPIRSDVRQTETRRRF